MQYHHQQRSLLQRLRESRSRHLRSGVKVATSWTRDYPEGTSLESIIGTVSSEKTGLPSDKVNEFLAEGYSRNDSVGQSYLEEQYESALKGTKSQTNVEVSGTKIMKEVKKYGGNKGDNLQLTINASFQKKLQALVKSAESSAGGYSTRFSVANPAVMSNFCIVIRDGQPSRLTVDC